MAKKKYSFTQEQLGAVIRFVNEIVAKKEKADKEFTRIGKKEKLSEKEIARHSRLLNEFIGYTGIEVGVVRVMDELGCPLTELSDGNRSFYTNIPKRDAKKAKKTNG